MEGQIRFTPEAGPPRSFGGRFEFLAALGRVCPEMLESLRLTVFGPHHTGWKELLPFNRPGICELVDIVNAGRSQDVQQASSALANWAYVHHVQDEWMYDAALQTMRSWLGGTAEPARWHYIPRGLEIRRFQPVLGYWVPPFDIGPDHPPVSRKDYRDAVTREFARGAAL